jgi:hypothetical protein
MIRHFTFSLKIYLMYFKIFVGDQCLHMLYKGSSTTANMDDAKIYFENPFITRLITRDANNGILKMKLLLLRLLKTMLIMKW